MTPITKSSIITFNTLLSKNNMKEEKKSIVQALSNGRANSTKDLYEEEIRPWIDAMIAQAPKPADPRQKMFNTIIAAAHEMGWIRKETVVQKDGSMKTVNNYDDLNKWIITKGYLKKPLNDYTYDELPTLVTAFRNVYTSWLRRHH